MLFLINFDKTGLTGAARTRQAYLELPVRLQRPDGRVGQPDVEQRPVAGAAGVLSTGEAVTVLLPQRSHLWLFSPLRN